jgi:transcriptional regulator with XRE-family HTH domain
MPLDHQKIATLRQQRALTLEEAATLAGLATRQQWWMIESGRRPNITPDTFHAVARALGVRMEELMAKPQEQSSPTADKPRARRRGKKVG